MNIILGVTGSISAYKACDIISGLKANGHEVQVILTKDGEMFIPEMPLAVLSERPVATNFEDELCGDVPHIDMANWADVFVVAPASANTIAKLVNGIADNVLTATALAFNRNDRKLICPAMNPNMYANPVTQLNVKNLESFGWDIMEPVEGTVACGDYGVGKLPKPRDIVERILKYDIPKANQRERNY